MGVAIFAFRYFVSRCYRHVAIMPLSTFCISLLSSFRYFVSRHYRHVAILYLAITVMSLLLPCRYLVPCRYYALLHFDLA